MKRTRTGSALVLAIGCPVFAADIQVPGDFETIQEAINAAVDRDRILVAPGVYTEQIDFLGKQIEVIGTEGAGETIIDAEGTLGYVVTMISGETRESVLLGFTIRGGFGEAGSLGAGAGGGMLIDGSSATISECIFDLNLGAEGGGISIFGGETLIRATEFVSNFGLFAGGIYVQGGLVTIDGCRFEGNEGELYGGGVSADWFSQVEISDSEFRGNTAGSYGGAIYANTATLNGTRLMIVDNGKAEPAGFNSWSLQTTGGGGIYTTSTNGRINASRIIDNIAAFGTGVYIASGGTMEIVNTLIASNGTICDCGTGAVYANASRPVIINSTIADNGGFLGIFTTYNAFPTVVNSILAGSENATGGNGVTRLEYSLYEGTIFSAEVGEGVIAAPALLDAGNDYAPLPGSPAIDAGDNTAVPPGVMMDLLGNRRFFDDPQTPDTGNGDAPIVDLGAIEFGSSNMRKDIRHRLQTIRSR